MTPKKISLEEWEQVENLPAANGLLVYKNGYCANGKMNLLLHGRHNYPENTGHLKDIYSQAAVMNNIEGRSSDIDDWCLPTMQFITYGKEHPQWPKHIQAFRWLLMKYVELGYVELEADLATEFAKVQSKDQSKDTMEAVI